MPKELIQKNIRLSHEFDSYISHSPRAYSRIPKGAHVVITSHTDKELSNANMSLMHNSRSGCFVEAHKSSTGWVIKTIKK